MKGVTNIMFQSINEEFNKAKNKLNAHRFIVESVLGVDEVLPGSDDEMEDVVDTDSVPDDAYKKLDAELDKIIDSPDYDDTEADEMIDDDIDDEEIEAVINEAVNYWHDPEWIGNPNVDARKGKDKFAPQPKFCATSMLER